ncbi:hypothetical protein B0H17DRAFT_1151581 [Mycena rosella]|uniref:Uncharacterized protein n=1 Tax=Mycena rosella TaxID=1033263 RepID=A0AAD7FGF5_MYCRO|nr:hypothetical protein B0H17DRAFT_1151581 [Mycena rosella]
MWCKDHGMTVRTVWTCPLSVVRIDALCNSVLFGLFRSPGSISQTGQEIETRHRKYDAFRVPLTVGANFPQRVLDLLLLPRLLWSKNLPPVALRKRINSKQFPLILYGFPPFSPASPTATFAIKMPVRSTAYISVLPHPGPPPTCPLLLLPTKVKAVKRAHPAPVPMKKVSPPGPKLPEGYVFVPLLSRSHTPAPERGAQAETRGLPNDYQYYQQSPPCEAPGTQGRFGGRVVLLPKRGDDLSDGVMKVKPRVQGPFCWRPNSLSTCDTDDGESGKFNGRPLLRTGDTDDGLLRVVEFSSISSNDSNVIPLSVEVSLLCTDKLQN